MNRSDTFDAAADALRRLARRYGADRATLTVKADGRATIVVEDGRGFTRTIREADTLPGGPLPTPGEALGEILS